MVESDSLEVVVVEVGKYSDNRGSNKISYKDGGGIGYGSLGGNW